MAGTRDIEVKSYQDVAFDGDWKARSRGLWGISFLGLLTGAAIGLLAPIVPALMGASIGLSEIGASLALFSATGMATGMLVGTQVGASSGAAASVTKELEGRDLARAEAIEQAMGVELPKPNLPKAKEKEQRYFNPKISFTFAAFGVLAGLVMAAAFFASGGAVATAAVPALSTLLGAKAAVDVGMTTAYFASVMGCFGAIFGINYPVIAKKFNNMAGDLLGGKALGTSWEKEPSPAQAQEIEQSRNIVDHGQYTEENLDLKSNHAEKLNKTNNIISFCDYVAKKSEENSTVKQL
jgi:hypothetical protein